MTIKVAERSHATCNQVHIVEGDCKGGILAIVYRTDINRAREELFISSTLLPKVLETTHRVQGE